MLAFTVLASIAISNVAAFTDGLMLPAYLCAPPGGNLPHSLGGVLKRMIFNIDIPLAFSTDPNQNLAPNPPMTPAGTAPNAAYMIASIHGSPNSLTPMQNAVTVSSTAALTAGAGMAITLTSPAADQNVDGTIIWAETAAGRIGSFTDAMGKMSAFPACGQDAQGNNFGMVHNQLLSDTNTYAGLTFNAPATLAAGDTVAIRGLAATDAGFGFFCQLFTVGSATAQPCTVDAATGATNFTPAPATAAGAAGAAAAAGAGTGAAAGTGAGAAAAASTTTAKATKTKTKKTKKTKTTAAAAAANSGAAAGAAAAAAGGATTGTAAAGTANGINVAGVVPGTAPAAAAAAPAAGGAAAAAPAAGGAAAAAGGAKPAAGGAAAPATGGAAAAAGGAAALANGITIAGMTPKA